VFAKSPELGRVKTRLQPGIPAETSLQLHRAFVEDTLEMGLREAAAPVVIAFSERPDPTLVPRQVEVELQVGEGLGQRLIHATRTAFRKGCDRLVVIGTDSPDLPEGRIRRAFEALERFEVCLGPAADGGYYLIGLRSEHEGLFQRIEWSTNRVLEQTLDRAAELGLQVLQLESWFDVDTPEDLDRLRQEIAIRRQTGRPFPRRSAALLDLLEPIGC
jgi:rSAM/selenodomain-associated transferase 1